MRAEPGPWLRSHFGADNSCGVWSIRLLRGWAESWDRQRHDFYISVFHNKHGHLQNNTESTHAANNLSASYITKILDMSSEERWNNNHPLQETEYITGWIHYSPKGESFIFFHSLFSPLLFFFFFKIGCKLTRKSPEIKQYNFYTKPNPNPNQTKTKNSLCVHCSLMWWMEFVALGRKK